MIDTEIGLFVRQFISSHPTEAAKELALLELDNAIEFLSQLSPQEASTFLPYIPRHMAILCIENISVESAAAIINLLPIETAASICRNLNRIKFDSMIDIEPKKKSRIKYLFSFDQNSAGSLIDPTVLSVNSSDSIESCFQKFKEKKQKAIYYLYIVDDKDQLLGVVTIKELLNHFNKKTNTVSSIMSNNVVSILGTTSIISLVKNDAWNHYHALPVVDKDGIYLGVLRYETIKKLEKSMQQNTSSDSFQVSSDLGELYSVGLSALFKGASSSFKKTEEQ